MANPARPVVDSGAFAVSDLFARQLPFVTATMAPYRKSIAIIRALSDLSELRLPQFV